MRGPLARDAEASLHRGAVLGGAAEPSRRAARGDHPAGRGAEPAEPAGRLPLPSALPARHGALRHRRAAARRGREPPCRLPSLCQRNLGRGGGAGQWGAYAALFGRRRHMALFMALLRAVPACGIATARPDSRAKGKATIAWHVTISPSWFDPSTAPPQITPFGMLYAIHDALVRPYPGQKMGPSLAEKRGGERGRQDLRIQAAPGPEVP